ncbi:FAD-dependent monooxygenase [Mesorhizobium japonicum]|uniref:Pentachlorophenol monooxygenase n=4 Tax=Phyllobacteriaceae TaxID=69277 RepID=A0A1A5IHT0_RHILI|nr:NAD(P)/FAD-dependent oxidoreductase [Mesorhizobium loti]MBE1707272.1 FAD-dependent monooxygenase [Mesorhizobium japonicum]QGX76602.1 FAD-dependent monooxygenase [Mesorhizobium japonicum R7A]MBE1715830.1 FAD-dependent monooxygenase [Mesorhizobium japonicum]MUT20508.1 pentachlorophenol monooxygenase [Mesorhizobium japonicum]MUT27963.1 pentachlorophenol monooxygenase [Mesorhizobium japonicum]
MLPDMTEILIIGAGPTGMALSIALHQANVDHVLIEKLAHGLQTSRAGVIHAQTLESLEPLGVTQRLSELSVKLEDFAIRDRNRALLKLDFCKLPSRHPYLMMLPQNLTEQVFAERISALGGTIHREVEAVAVAQDSVGARVTVVQNGQEKIISARYVVGADGMQSLVRKSTGIEFDGAAYDGSFVLADVRLDWPAGPTEVSLFFAPAGLVVVAPLPDGSYRVVATMDEAPEKPDVADIQALLDSRGPTRNKARVLGIGWSSRFRLHHRLVRAYRKDRLFLMGDAAHVHSPAGGQGMNTGIIDAVVLGQLLGDVVNGVRSEAELDLYETLRRPAAQEVLDLAGRMTDMALARNPVKRFLRNLALSVVDLSPFLKRRIALKLSGLSRAPLARLPAPSAMPGAVEASKSETGPKLKLAA